MNNYETPAVLGSFEAGRLMGEAFGTVVPVSLEYPG